MVVLGVGCLFGEGDMCVWLCCVDFGGVFGFCLFVSLFVFLLRRCYIFICR